MRIMLVAKDDALQKMESHLYESFLPVIYLFFNFKNYVFYLINPLSYSPDHVEKESNAKMARFLIEIRK